MKYFKNIQEKDGVLTFELHSNQKVYKSLANAIRRTIIAQIPTIAIDKSNVIYLKNTSVLNSEVLSKRLALIPINYKNAKKLDLEKLEIKLDANNDTDNIKDIFVSDFQIFEGEKEIDIKTLVEHDDILYIKLKPFQSLVLKAQFMESTLEKNGAEFTPTSVAIFTFAEDTQTLQKALNNIPADEKKDFTILNKERIYLQDKNGEPSIFNFTFETVGQIPNKNLFDQGMEILINKLDHVVKALMENDREIIYIDIPKIAMNAFDFMLPDENDTLGNLLQTYLVKNDKVSFAGYDITHPLRKVLIIRLALKNNNNLENNKTVFIENITEIKKFIMELRKDLNSTTVKTIAKTITKEDNVKTTESSTKASVKTQVKTQAKTKKIIVK